MKRLIRSQIKRPLGADQLILHHGGKLDHVHRKHHFARSLDYLLRVAWARCVLLCTSRGRSTEARERMDFEPMRNEASAEATGSVAAKLIKKASNSRSGNADLLDDFAAAVIERSGMPRPQKRRQPQASCRPAMSPLKEILKYKSRLRSRV
jgi:hypothetical protein